MGSGATPSPPDRRRARPWRRGAIVAAVLLLAVATLLAGLAWLGWTEAGLHTALRLASRATDGQLQVDGARGRLAGSFSADELRFETPDLRLRVRELRLAWRPGALGARRLQIDTLSAAGIDFASRPTEEESPPPTPPAGLELPFAVDVVRVEVGRLVLRAWPAGDPASGAGNGFGEETFVVTDLSAALAGDGRSHRLKMLAATLPFGRAALAGELGGRTPFPLNAAGALLGEHEGHPWRLDFTADGDLLAPRLAAEASGAGLTGHADLEAAPFAAIPLRRLQLTMGDVDPSAFAPAAPRAALRLEADLAPAAADAWALAGPVRIDNHRPDTVDRGGIPVERLAARLHWTPEVLGLDGLEVALLGKGRLGGSLRWQIPQTTSAAADGAEAVAGDPYGRLSAALELQNVEARRLDTRLPAVVIAGRLDATGDDREQTVALDLRAGTARVGARGVLVPVAEDARSGAPAARGDGQDDGRDRGADAPAVRAFELSAVLRDLDPRLFHPEAPTARLNLELDARGRIGPVPWAELAFRMPGSLLEGEALSGEGRLRLEPGRVSDADLVLDLAGNRATAQGAWGAAGDRLAFTLVAPDLSVLGRELRGRAAVEGTLAGTPEQPAGAVRFFAERLGLPGNIHLAGANGEAELEAGLDGPFHLAVGISGLGPAGGKEPDWVSAGHLAIVGSRGAHRIEFGAEGLEGDRIDMHLEGGLPEPATAAGAPPQWRWRGRVLDLQTAGRFPARLRAPADVEAAAGDFRLGQAELDAGARGRITLEETRWSPGEAVLRGRLSGLSFGLIAGAEGRRRRGPGPLELGAEWDLRLAETVEGDARLFRESGDLVVSGQIPARLGLEHFEARLAARGDRLAVSVVAQGSELGEFTGSVTAHAERGPEGGWRLAPDQALLGSARLAMPSIAWMGRLMEENIDTAGSLEADFSISGTPAEPVASGRIHGRDLTVVLADQGLHLSGGELVAEFDRDQLRLARLAFVSPNRVRPRDGRLPVDALTRSPGTLEASGAIALDSGEGRFRFDADRLPILQRSDRWLLLSGAGSVRSTWSSADIEAALRTDAGYVELAETPPPSLSDDVVVLGRKQAPSGEGFKLGADVRVELGDHLYLSALGVDTRLSGDLRLRLAPGAPLTAHGAIATVGGSFRGYGQALTIERGLITFQGPLDNPGLNVVALRKGLEVEAGVAITGSARRPKVQLVSEPPVPDPEKLSWIVLGRPPDAASGADLSLLLPAAQALLGAPGGGITDQLSRSLGLDQLSIGQGDLTSPTRTATSRVVGSGSTVNTEGTISGQVLSLGKRLSSDLFLSFEQSLGGAESLVKLTYQLGRRVSLVARGGTDNAVDLYYTFSFR